MNLEKVMTWLNHWWPLVALMLIVATVIILCKFLFATFHLKKIAEYFEKKKGVAKSDQESNSTGDEGFDKILARLWTPRFYYAVQAILLLVIPSMIILGILLALPWERYVNLLVCTPLFLGWGMYAALSLLDTVWHKTIVETDELAFITLMGGRPVMNLLPDWVPSAFGLFRIETGSASAWPVFVPGEAHKIINIKEPIGDNITAESIAAYEKAMLDTETRGLVQPLFIEFKGDDDKKVDFGKYPEKAPQTVSTRALVVVRIKPGRYIQFVRLFGKGEKGKERIQKIIFDVTTSFLSYLGTKHTLHDVLQAGKWDTINDEFKNKIVAAIETAHGKGAADESFCVDIMLGQLADISRGRTINEAMAKDVASVYTYNANVRESEGEKRKAEAEGLKAELLKKAEVADVGALLEMAEKAKKDGDKDTFELILQQAAAQHLAKNPNLTIFMGGGGKTLTEIGAELFAGAGTIKPKKAA